MKIVMQDELLDIVDQHDQVIGQKYRSEVYSQGISNFRVVNAFLLNDVGQLWIPRRTREKRIFPLCLDASMGGHVSAGESYQEAFAREMQEELRIDITKQHYTCLGSLNPYTHETSAFMQLYLIKTNSVPDFNPDDYCEYYWLNPIDLLNRIASGDQSKSDLPIMTNYVMRLLVDQSS